LQEDQLNGKGEVTRESQRHGGRGGKHGHHGQCREKKKKDDTTQPSGGGGANQTQQICKGKSEAHELYETRRCSVIRKKKPGKGSMYVRPPVVKRKKRT